ncbi:MAG: transcriptional regulator NrdR, partial [Microcystaceae cyanobacterium]
MQCPYCQHTNSRVLESRSTEGGQSIRRRRECLQCKHRFTTYERIEFVPITVIKKDGKRESFDRSKLLRGMVRACEKTSISHRRLEALVDDLEAQIQQRPEREVTSREIGELVLEYLRHENEVAYIRFASVYGEFQCIKEFAETLSHLRNDTRPSDWTCASEPEAVQQPDNNNTPPV